ncbi:hypothetical protein PPYR_04070 [Photinus pyralis]|uniref:Protein TEX261 n=1 Tax=Photinus pyralis TaxID=7054 RepID=A0A5N4AX17_PHOPY|nr:protein TEX261 [Photinus pyralis]KAB0801884.1 hypothetical protein PPYR_04070 [Photinus pyralis]
MLCLTLITYLSFVVQISFVTIAVAAGLYYLAEFVEEYTVLSKKIIWWMNSGSLIIYILLWLFEGFPLLLVSCGILAQVSHFVILTDFPYISFLSPSFLIAIAFIVINHYLAFDHFGNVMYSFSELMAYFTLCLWLVPFALFLSLSANENALPTVRETSDGDVVSNYFSKKEKKYGLLSLFNYAKEAILPHQSKKGF